MNLKILNRDNGYTFIEVFIVLLIVALISTVIYTNSSKILNSLDRGSINLQNSYDLLNLRHTLFLEAQKIQTPWFFKEHSIVHSEDFIEIFYYNGHIEESITLASSISGTYISVNGSIIFSSKSLIGEFSIEDSTILFKTEGVKFTFILGVILA